MKQVILIILIFYSSFLLAQNRNSNWCFGDSAGIYFNGTNTTLFNPAVVSRGSCATISDSLGQLLFYYSDAPDGMSNGHPNENGNVYDKNHQLIQNGDLIFSELWYQEGLILPYPDSSSLYYLFTIGVLGNYGLYYSIIDMSLNSGDGAVIIKNIQVNNDKASDGIIAIKHGNGRDWWIISRRWDTSNDEFYEHLVTPQGVSNAIVQNVGSATISGFYWMSFSPSGNKFVGFDPSGLFEIFNFDRCTGVVTLDTILSQEVMSSPYPYFWGAAFSPSERYLYVSKYGDINPVYPTYLIQFDLYAPNIIASADTLWTYSSSMVASGALRLAPDGKIYFTCGYNDGINFPYPYPDSLYNTTNNNLSVINYPDSPGVACGFAPFSFNLGAGRCYWGLPNNPDYELGAVVNSACDTVTSVGSLEPTVGSRSLLHLFFHDDWKILFVNAENIKGRDCKLQIFDVNGREVFSSAKKTQPPYFTEDVNCGNLADGMYIVKLQTEKEVLTKKFVKE